MRCVRPLLTTSANSSALRCSEASRWRRAGIRSRTIAPVAATWMAEGNTSFEDCDAFTWSLGCTGLPSASVARLASTSLVFMLLDVPEPVWNTSIGKWSSQSPRTTVPAAPAIASAMPPSRTPRSALTRAAAPLIAARAAMSSRSIGVPEIGKFSTARCVCALHLAQVGTRTSPIESCSTRYSVPACSVVTLRSWVRSGGGGTSVLRIDPRSPRMARADGTLPVPWPVSPGGRRPGPTMRTAEHGPTEETAMSQPTYPPPHASGNPGSGSGSGSGSGDDRTDPPPSEGSRWPAQPPTGGEQQPTYGQQRPTYGQQPTYGSPRPTYGQQPTYGAPSSYGSTPSYPSGQQSYPS